MFRTTFFVNGVKEWLVDCLPAQKNVTIALGIRYGYLFQCQQDLQLPAHSLHTCYTEFLCAKQDGIVRCRYVSTKVEEQVKALPAD